VDALRAVFLAATMSAMKDRQSAGAAAWGCATALFIASGCGTPSPGESAQDGAVPVDALGSSADASSGDAVNIPVGDANGSGDASGSGDANGSGDASGSTDAADSAASDSGDTFGPWAGGAGYYAKFSNGPPSDPSFFPVSVWLQDPSLASQYAAIGINLFVGLWQGPTAAQLTTLAQSTMPVACTQDSVGLAHATDKTIVAWTQDDEPDNAQPIDGGYGPCVAPSAIVARYQAWRSSDPTRPVYLNVGQGVANDAWNGRGSCSGHPQDYAQYAKGADIVSFDVYPVNDGLAIALVATGIDRLRAAVNDQKPVWNWIECTGINGPSGKPTPAQTKAEVWMSIVHGSMGIGYFVHQFQPTQDVHALLDDPTMKAAVAAINAQIHQLAPVLNAPPVTNTATVTTPSGASPVDILVKRQGGNLYVFAVSMGSGTAMATFSIARAAASATAVVLGENRTIAIQNGTFQDSFGGYAVHLYEVQ
jgi:hypothetical protein